MSGPAGGPGRKAGPPARGHELPGLTDGDFENLLAFRTSLRRFMHWSQSHARAAGLTPGQHQLLVAIKGHPGPDPPAVSELAGYLLLRHHSVVELIDWAAVAGLVDRQGDPEDRRLTRIGITAKGEARLARLAPAHLGELRTLALMLDHLVAQWDSGTRREGTRPAQGNPEPREEPGRVNGGRALA